MANARRRVLPDRSFRVLWVEGSVALRSDADLLRIVLAGHGEAAEAAFSALIERHGPMVLGTCRRILRDEHAAEDAFQAVFLVLARKARSVRVDDSLGPWLRGVARRVAARARQRARREVPAAAIRREPPDDPAVAAVRAEVRQVIAREVALLPRKYREAVALCHLDGLSHDQAAEALGLPVGTVRSRLSRARDLLRTRVVRRGLAPAALAAWLGHKPAVASVPRALLETTLKAAAGGTGVTTAPAVLALAESTLRSMIMAKLLGAGGLIAALGCLTTGAIVLARGGDGPPTGTSTRAAATGQDPVPPPVLPLEDQFRRIIAEFDEAKAQAGRLAEAARSDFERWRTYGEKAPDEAAYARRIVDLASAYPKEIAARDALIWVMNKPYQTDGGPYGDEFARAVRLLVQHHADDPEVARVGLGLENVLSRRRDAFLEGIYASAENRETRGLVRMALAETLEKKALSIVGTRKARGRVVARSRTYDDQGDLVERTFPLSNEDEGYRVYLRMLDPEFVRAECERLYEEVIAEYGDIPYITTRYRELERQAHATPSATVADPKRREEMIGIERYLAMATIPTLGKVAEGRLDDLRNLAVGKAAPEFEGLGADGETIKLSAYRGKVVVLVYWFSSCGPCLREIPVERELAEKMRGRPFTLLGIVTDDRADDARRVIASERMAWPNLVIGGEKVAERYHVRENPSYFVLDADGVIRSKGYALPSELDKLIGELVSEAEAKAGGRE